MLLRLSLFAAGLVGVALVAQTGCGSGSTITAGHVLTATITLGNESALIVNAPIAIAVVGTRRSGEIHVRAELVVTGTTAAAAKEKAEKITLLEERIPAQGLVRLTLPGTQDELAGKIVLEVPADLDLGLNGGATIEAKGMDGSYDVRALSTVLIAGAQKNVIARTSAGGIQVETLAAPGSTTDLEVSTGNLDLILPAVPSVQFQVAAGGGMIGIDHPQLPPWSGGGNPYQVSVNGGLALARLVTQAGNVLIRGKQ